MLRAPIAIDGVVVQAMRLANTTDVGAARRFTIGPDGYKLVEARAPALSGTLAYAIISARGGVPAGSRLWRLRDDRTGFDEGELIWVTGS